MGYKPSNREAGKIVAGRAAEETLRRVREWAIDNSEPDGNPYRTKCAREVLAILNGTERKETKRG